MFDEKLKQILQIVYAGRVLVFSNYKIRQTLFSKGISPSIFLHHFYERCGGDSRIDYTVKQKSTRELGDVVPMDVEQFQYFKEDRIKSLLRERVSANYKIKPSREISREALMSKQLSENYLRSLHFSWFEQASKLFLYYMTLDDQNHKQGFLEQPLGLTFLIEIDPTTNIRSEYEKIKKESDLRLKKMFSINPQRVKNLPLLVIIVYNQQNKVTYKDAQNHFESLRYEFKLDMDLTFVLEICNQEAKDMTEWSCYSRPIFNIQYKLQPSDPIRLLSDKDQNSLRAFVINHRIKIRDHIQSRLKQLCKRYEQNNTAKSLFISFFKGSSSTQRCYSVAQAETRQIADFLFLLGDHKRAIDIYKSLADKFESNQKDQSIHFNICEMIQLSKCMSIFSPQFNPQNRPKIYESIEKHAQKTMIKKATSISKFKLNRYLLYLLYFFHCFKIFNRDFIKNHFYYYIKKSVNEETVSQNYSNPLIIPALLHQQHANLNLMFPVCEYRRYCYDLVRVASKFSEYKLYYHNLRCFLIASKIYDGSFPLIERYINTSLCKAYLQLKKHRDTISCYQNTWNTLLKNYEDLGMKDYDLEFTKFENNYKKIVMEVEKANPAEAERENQECIPVPKLQNLVIQLVDENISSSEDGESTWQKVGDIFLEKPQLTSKGMNKQNMVKLLKMFDSVSTEQRQLSFGVKNMQTTNGVSQAILKRNARVSFIGQPILVSFDMKNYLPNSIQFDSIQLFLKIDKPCSIRLKRQSNSFYLEAGHSENIVFEVIPKEVGLYQFSHISWKFSKLKSLHKFKEPWESLSTLKSVYCKINVLQQTGLMNVDVKHSNKYYQGQLSQIQLVFSNIGKQEIEQIYIATDNQNIFNFRSKKLQFTVPPGQKRSQSISIIIPLFDSNKNKTSYWKCVNKSIFLYKTKTSFRVLRNVTIFNIHKIGQINNVVCQRISRNLHFLSFSIKYGTNQSQDKRMLKSLVIDGNMDIKKTQSNEFGVGIVQYFFFLRRNYQKMLEEYKFTLHGMNCAELISQNQIKTIEKQNRNDDSLNLYFVWSHQNDFGIMAPPPTSITATTNTDSQTKLPFSVKIMMQDQIQFNFDQNPLLQIQVQFRIKNIFDRKQINLCVELSEAGSNDIYWQGITQHFLHLKYNQESRFKVKILLFRSGIYNIAKNIKYINSINKANSYTINHNQYQNLYLLVRNPKRVNEQQFDFFANFQSNTFKKAEKKEELSLI